MAFALQWAVGSAFTNEFLFYPPFALSEPWRFLTSAFLHSPSFVLHILFNMYALWLRRRCMAALEVRDLAKPVLV